MKARTKKPSFQQGSGILQEAMEVIPCTRNEATHFIIFHGERIKYIISLDNGIARLKETIAAYNNKLRILLNALPLIPMQLLVRLGIGTYAQVKLHKEIQIYVPEHHQWNILIGTYDEAQKIVLQCFSRHQADCIYIKVGNIGSTKQMMHEIQFLRSRKQYTNFAIPKLIDSSTMGESGRFNILVTDEFKGKKIRPCLTEELYRISCEIAGESTIIDGIPHAFSHGDFAPWNIRKSTAGYTVFDWEHCKLRPEGYDIAYFVIVSEIALHRRKFDDAFCIAIEQIRQFDSDFQIDKQLLRQEFEKSVKNLCF